METGCLDCDRDLLVSAGAEGLDLYCVQCLAHYDCLSCDGWGKQTNPIRELQWEYECTSCDIKWN